ncbi:hypothetical protein ACFOD0_15025 [Shewanella intestini]|uniref:Uncharacterized protein n=1 Tax=Shewanella intestini TaxID=2017544 RepID=A0ABS5I664_9GAMM|nr:MULTISPECIES: hypothetical protein [Shewanella]MBR9729411.1 hypothetical protein [Shewanella intestini]MRG37491.1 hypothetical protein [Shewanella sp. XMDDZSB0408]
MQIGSCWFNIDTHTLIDQENNHTWQLDEQSYWVLNELSLCRGQVKPFNHFSYPNVKSCAMNEDDIAKVIHLLRHFLGRHACLIELIPSVGIILHHRKKIHKTKVLDEPNAVMSMSQFIAIITILLCALMMIYSGISSSVYDHIDFSVDVYDRSGNKAELEIYTDPVNYTFVQQHKGNFIVKLSQCTVFQWDTISASLSKDRHMINLVLKRIDKGKWSFHNIKVLRSDYGENFSSLSWFKEVDICD